jgi:hypothetical protein
MPIQLAKGFHEMQEDKSCVGDIYCLGAGFIDCRCEDAEQVISSSFPPILVLFLLLLPVFHDHNFRDTSLSLHSPSSSLFIYIASHILPLIASLL